MALSLSQVIALYRSAPATIKHYEERKLHLTACLDLVKTAEGSDKAMLEKWIEESTDWLILEVETYHRCKFIESLRIAEKDMDEIQTLYNNIYKED